MSTDAPEANRTSEPTPAPNAEPGSPPNAAALAPKAELNPPPNAAALAPKAELNPPPNAAVPEEREGVGERLFVAAATWIAGASIGWLVGLSMTPIVQGVVTTFTGILATTVTLWTGIQPAENAPKPRVRVRPVPIAAVMCGIAIGASAGLWARTHDWFSADPVAFVRRWEKTGIPSKELAVRALDLVHPIEKGEPGRTTAAAGVLMNAMQTECEGALMGATPEEQLEHMRSSTSKLIRSIAENAKDAQAAKSMVEEICKPSQ